MQASRRWPRQGRRGHRRWRSSAWLFPASAAGRRSAATWRRRPRTRSARSSARRAASRNTARRRARRRTGKLTSPRAAGRGHRVSEPVPAERFAVVCVCAVRSAESTVGRGNRTCVSSVLQRRSLRLALRERWKGAVGQPNIASCRPCGSEATPCCCQSRCFELYETEGQPGS